MIRAVLFDLDGTLIDTNKLIMDSFKKAFKEILDIEPPEEEIAMLFGRPLVQTLGQYSEERVDDLVKTYRDYNESNHDNMCNAFEGVKEMLIQLKNMGIKTGIVTSKRASLAKRGMEISGILNLMDVIITPESTEKHKPDAEPALKACEILNIKPSEAIMVGDATYDILCGKGAGCKTIGVKYTAIPLEELRQASPDYFIEKPMDVIEILKELKENIA
ncbi:pyrophosphatase PpaX [Clostridium paridis]|uniref:Pyrophosphatase PpaX n=1 Tax=Clostridium paridis TaxID=2803863 RepID=A0A937FEZ3_9CLOT|nr:pyrophosphatase PpaX [Clostridium paridis]MBL4932119.1 pyrophosphatase PpaX [Clostridium paridis]